MRRVRSRDTKPELTVRSLVFSMGYRYRLHRRSLPGTPDLVFPSRSKAIFVHGCFWHLHDCGKYRLPHSREDYWLPKLKANKRRDDVSAVALRGMGWDVLTIWECELRDVGLLSQRIRLFLDGDRQ